MSDIDFTIDATEALVLEAALAIYRRELAAGVRLGGQAREVAASMDPVAQRVQMRLHDALYGTDEPEWLPEGLPEFNGAFGVTRW